MKLLGVLAALAVSCGGARHGELDSAPLHHTPPDEIIVRTDRFVFHMGARVDEAWPARAEETRVALGRSAETLLDQEDTTVAILARQLGVVWPTEPLDFDVLLSADERDVAPCATKLPRRLEVTLASIAHPQPDLFFACALERGFTRLAAESALARALGGAGDAGAGGFYACLTGYAVAVVLIAGTHDARVSRRLELGLSEMCSPRELDWLGTEWVKRVRDDESAEAFGARARRQLTRE